MLLLLVLVQVLVLLGSARPLNEFKMLRYLAQFGYADPAANMDGEITSALRQMQLFTGGAATGRLDEATSRAMAAPRCGDPDVRPGNPRSARFALQGGQWSVRNLTYRVGRYPSRCLSRAAVDAVLSRASQVWASVADVSFTAVPDGPVHTELRFEAGAHGDADAFDGPGGVLAHAHFPRHFGDAHLDDEETWNVDSSSGTDLLRVAVHVLGHALGLPHSAVRGAAMAPLYGGLDADAVLHKSDVDTAQAIYGKRPPEVAPAICEDVAVDAFFTDAGGHAVAFKGDAYYKVRDGRIVRGHPKRISDSWAGLPGDIDAAFTYSNGRTYFFKADQYWRYKGLRADGSYPKLISRGFPGVPSHVNAALLWGGDVYFFKDSQVWALDFRRGGRARLLQQWTGLPERVDAALLYRGRSYLFKGSKYYRVNVSTPAVEAADPAFPRPTGRWWFGC